MLVDFFTREWITVHGLLTMAGLVIYGLASYAWRQRRHPSAAIAWIISLTLLPEVALPLYLLIGNRKIVREAPQRRLDGGGGVDSASATPAARLLHLAGAMGLPPAAPYGDLRIDADGGAALERVLDLLAKAERQIDVCTFILGRDAVGAAISAALIERARAGVKVRLLIDSIGIWLGGRPNLKPLAAAGVRTCMFVSPWRSPLPGRTNLRNHRKMIIVDGATLWTGGRNLAAEYFTGDPASPLHRKPWNDLSFTFEGILVTTAARQFERDWAFASGEPLAEPALPASRTEAGGATAQAQFIASGPDQADDTFYAMMVSSCYMAQTRILAVTPYYVPDAALQMAFTLAALRGVRVDLVLPRVSNHALADIARNAALRELQNAGGRIWLMPEMIHAKGIVVDDTLALSGSANLDERSLFLNYEMMIAFFDQGDVRAFAQWIDGQRQRARSAQLPATGMARAFLENLVRWLAFQI